MNNQTTQPDRVISIRLSDDLYDAIHERAEEVDRSMNWIIKNWLQVMRERLEASTIDSPVNTPARFASEWAAADERGSCGHSYGVHVSFSLPAVVDADFAAYDTAGAIRQICELMGGRNVTTDMMSYAPLQEDTREVGGVVVSIS